MCMLLFALGLLPLTTSFAEVSPPASVEVCQDSFLQQKATLPLLHTKGHEEEMRMAAYLQGGLDTKYPEYSLSVSIHKGVITISNMPQDPKEAQKIISFVQSRMSSTTSQTPAPPPSPKMTSGLWFPESTVLFPTQVANPRQVTLGAGFRVSDKIAGHWSSPVTLGAQIPAYRWNNIWKGDLQVELEAAVFSLFNLNHADHHLVNADYYVGLPLTWAKDDWRARFRIYHVSSHLGDEYMVRHPHVHRKNKSFEAIDASCAYYVLPEWYFFGTFGGTIRSDKSLSVKGCYIEYGTEVRGKKQFYTQLYGDPFLSLFLRNAQDTHFGFDFNAALGYEWGKITDVGRMLRIFLSFHQGYSVEGQFSHKKSSYVGLGFTYGF